MRSKNAIVSANLTDKNRIYLQRLGLIDNRNGRWKPNKGMSRFINLLITNQLEMGMTASARLCGAQMASADELRQAWILFIIADKSKQVEKINKEIYELGKLRQGMALESLTSEMEIKSSSHL